MDSKINKNAMRLKRHVRVRGKISGTPEPYKGKGIKYSTEVIRRKVGKTGGKK